MTQPGQDPRQLAEQIAELERQIAFHNRRYYDQDQPLISDPEYDRLRRELETLKPDSPVLQDVGHAAFGEKYRHPVMMGSLQKCHAAAEILKKFAGAELTLLPKIDGCSLSLHYENGSLVRAVTRGDGVEGELITANARFVQDVSAAIPPRGQVEVRGEAYIAKADFYGKMDQGDAALANPRNATAGGLRQKDPNFTRERRIRFVAYELLGVLELTTHAAKVTALQSWHFTTPPVEIAVFTEEGAIAATLERLRAEFEKLPYEIDGVVIRRNDQAAYDAEGWTGKCPKAALAFKFETEKKAARVIGIDWATSRNGRVCPVALIEPTLICGSTVSRITLHNLEWLQAQDVAVGDLVRFEKANEIIPKLVEVLERPASRTVLFPETCPSCATALLRDGVDLNCPNPDCPAQFEETVIHLLDELGIKGVAGATLEKIVAWFRTQGNRKFHPWEVLDLTRDKLVAMGFGPKQAENIEAAVHRPRAAADQVLSALGIPGWGRRFFEILLESGICTAAELLAGAIPDRDKVAAVYSLGEKRADALLEGFRTRVTFLRELQARVEIEQPASKPADGGLLAGKSFCITGTLSRPREEIQEQIRKLGGVIREAVSAKLHFLVAGENAGSKLAKAHSCGVTVLTEAEFAALCAGASQPPPPATAAPTKDLDEMQLRLF